MARPSGRRTSQFTLPQSQPQPSVPSAENNFTGGLKTEYTGLNFPENSCVATENCTFFRVGNVSRRNGIDFELNFSVTGITGANVAFNSFIWTNAGGDGQTKLYVVQAGTILYFYQLTNSIIASPISTTLLASTVTLTAGADGTKECQFASGNGYLFIFHPSIDPLYCTFTSGIVTSFVISLNIRDFAGIFEPAVPDNFRPSSLSAEHNYNLFNQAWSNAQAWSTFSPTAITCPTSGNVTFTVGAGITPTPVGGDPVQGNGVGAPGFSGNASFIGSVVSYAGTTMVINITSTQQDFNGNHYDNWSIYKSSAGLISTFFTANSVYPSNSDIWYTFKNSSGIFSPSTTSTSVGLGTGPAPKGSFILKAFDQERRVVSGIAGLTPVTTTARPRTGAFFQGRVWYAGVDSSFSPAGDEPFYTWTENIYFSQIITTTQNFGQCYQTNDPTSETLNTLLPSDGGVIVIQGCGAIYKLFPLQNGLLVFASNGIWFITGASGIGFTADNYSVVKISGVQSISGTSIVDVLGLPMFWAGDAIYAVTASMQGQQAAMGESRAGLTVQNLSLTTIQSFYNAIPPDSKKFVRGDYNPLTGQIQWCFRSTQEAGISNRYVFDSILNFSTFTQAFYPWFITSPNTFPIDVKYITYTQLNSPPPLFKYLTINAAQNGLTFAEERDNVNWKDWVTAGTPTDYTSFFNTAYMLKGQAQRQFQPQYIYLYSELSNTDYKIQGLWDYGQSLLSNRFSSIQVVNTFKPYFGKTIRRHRIRGNGYVLQFAISSVTGKPFNFAGWSAMNTLGNQ